MAIEAGLLKKVVRPSEGAEGYRDAAAGRVTVDDAARILEIACLAVAADGKIADEEVDAVRVLGTEVRALAGAKGAVSAVDIDDLVNKCVALGSRDAQIERLRALSDALSGAAAKHVAYKVAVATAMADLASADEEFEFDIDLLDALRLSNDEGDRLAGEVHEALTPSD